MLGRRLAGRLRSGGTSGGGATGGGGHGNGFATELRTNALVKELVDSAWTCKDTQDAVSELKLSRSGDASMSSGSFSRGSTGRWGSMNDPSLGAACPVYSCLFIDFGGSKHDARIEGEEGARKRLVLLRDRNNELSQLSVCNRR